jgi:DNA-binding transcriptional LysR family regulator
VVVELDSLAALDALQWLRTGDEVYRRFGYSESTVSRQCRKCLQLFGLSQQRIEGEWCTVGDAHLLQLERRVHQLARWLGRRPLRLEATYWSGPLLATPTPAGWLLGLCNIVGIGRNFQLLRDRIVDVFLAGLPDLPAADDPDLTAIVLADLPVFYVARPDHPLVGQRQLSVEQIAQYPSLGLPEGAYPKVEAALRALGLWNDPVRMGRYRRERWEGRAEAELVVGYGTSLSLEVSGGQLVRLPLELPFRSGEALVVRRDHVDRPELLALQHCLMERLGQLARRHPDLTLLSPAGDG